MGRISADVVAAANIGEVTIELAPAETRPYTSEQLGLLWREETGPVPEAVAIDLHSSLLSAGEDVNVELYGSDLDRLRAAADRLRGGLAAYAGVVRTGKSEMRLDIRPAAEGLGLRLQDLARQVRQAFYGEEAQRIQRGRDEVRVMVRPERRPAVARQPGGHAHTPAGRRGGAVQPGGEPGRGFASIRRIDRNRAVNVTASVDPQVVSASALIADLRDRILPQVREEFPDVFYVFRGTQEAQEQAVGDLRAGLLLALVLIFGLLAIPLRSYAQPLIIMGAIPFGLVGALWGHVVMGLDVTFLSLLGLVALTGIVVNDSLSVPAGAGGPEGLPPAGGQPAAAGLEDAIRQAGGQRFRPIVLTSLTTFAGLIPMLADRSMQAAFFVPMAASLAFGVLFATVITLFLVPVA